MKSKYSFFLLISVFVFKTFISCKTKKEGIEIKVRESKLPIKILIGSSSEDSTRIKIFVPQEFEFRSNYNSKIKHSKTYISMNGGNISDYGKNPLYQLQDSLVRLPGRNYYRGEGHNFIFYSGYTLNISNSEKDSLSHIGQFAQFKRNRKIYNFVRSEGSYLYVNKKIPDSLKGFIHMDFYNFDSKGRFVENIPITF